MLVIESFDDALGLHEYGGGIQQMEATTKPSTGSLSVLKAWDLKDEPLCEEN